MCTFELSDGQAGSVLGGDSSNYSQLAVLSSRNALTSPSALAIFIHFTARHSRSGIISQLDLIRLADRLLVTRGGLWRLSGPRVLEA